MSSRPLSVAAALEVLSWWGARYWHKQEDIVRAVFGPNLLTVVQSCTSSGKTHIAAAIIIAWMLTGRGRRVVTTAPSQRQVNSQVWSEIRAIAATLRALGTPLGGDMPPKAASWVIANRWDAEGFATDNDANFAGKHSEGGTLVVVDDAQGLDDKAWDTIEATLTGRNDRMLALANPVEPSGNFYEYCQGRGGDKVNRIVIDGLDVPNVVEGREVFPGMLTREKIEYAREAWGEASPLFVSRIRGKFPDKSNRVLVPLDWLHASYAEHARLTPLVRATRPDWFRLSADLAGEGKDRGISTVVGQYRIPEPGTNALITVWYVEPQIENPKVTTMETVGYLAGQRRDKRASSFRVDKGGLGVGIFDRLRELGVPVVGLVGGNTAERPDRYTNARTEWHMTLRELLQPQDRKKNPRPRLLLPMSSAISLQASSMLIQILSDERVKLEPKDAWKARHKGKSPDELDSLVMALCEEPVAADKIEGPDIGAYLRAYG